MLSRGGMTGIAVAIGLVGCATVVQDVPTKVSAVKMTCDSVTKKCRTPQWGLREDRWKGERISWRVETPQGWTLAGNPSASYAGKGVYDVSVTEWGPTFLTCQWHAEGGWGLFASGGWVAGYCFADGVPPVTKITPPPAKPGKKPRVAS